MGRRRTAARTGARVALLGTTLAACLLLGGCAGGPPRVDPSGVDGLVIPTPSARPADFVRTVDNPWFPLAPGTVRTYRATSTATTRTDTVTVTDDTRVVQGVTTTVVHDVTTTAGGRVVEDTYDWYAQDSAGNVWRFGTDTTSYDGRVPSTHGSWEAGVDGAEAGLMMPATPRVGDGYRQELRPGVAEDVARVLSLDEQRTVAAGTFGGLLQVEITSPLAPGRVDRRYYARGLGVVYEETVTGSGEQVELLDVSQP